MGLQSDDYRRQLLEQSKLTAPVQPTGNLTPEQQTQQFGGEVGSVEYYNYQANNPLKSFLFKGIAESFGLELTDQETWDKTSAGGKAGYIASAAPSAAWKMVKNLPKEIVKAPLRVGVSVAQPWLDLAKGKPVNFETEAQKPVKRLPWLGEIPTYWQSYDEARQSGIGPGLAALSTGSLALGDVTLAASLGEGIKAAIQPRAKIGSQPVINVKPIERVVAQEAGAARVVSKSPGSASEYYSLPQTVAKKYGGGSNNTFLKVTPSDIGGANMEVSIVQTRGGTLQKATDYLKGRGDKVYQGDFGPELKFESQIVPAGKAPVAALAEGEAESILASIPPKALKGFENKTITGDQITHLGKLSQVNNIDSGTGQAIVRNITGKNALGDMTQAEYVQVAQTMSAFRDIGKFTPDKPSVNIFSQYGSPQRHWMRSYEERSGIPLYSEAYVPMEDAMRLRNVFRDGYRNRSREIFGKYANPGYAEERRLIKSFMEGNTDAINANDVLSTQVKADLTKIANEMAPIYDKLGDTFGIPREVFLKDYQPHIQTIGGIYQLYKEGTQLPKELSFFAEFKRKGALSVQVDDALALFDIYTNAGSNKMFLNPALERINGLGQSLPANLANSVKSYVGEKHF